jgi:PAS domain S-box-containing protein
MKYTNLSNGSLMEALFDALPDVVFFIKDRHGRYERVNQTFANRCAGGDKSRLVGRLPGEVFPAPLAGSYARQDEAVLRTGKPVEHQLELHIYPGGKTGWCLTTKQPLRNDGGEITGLGGISRDLNAPAESATGFAELAAALRFMRRRFHEVLRIEEIAARSGLSVHQFESRVRRLFQMSPMQLLHKLRLDEGIRLLRETDSTLAEIALQTGWCDQSAFTRHFSRYTGISPGRYRAMRRWE